jgi:hypothetical protein
MEKLLYRNNFDFGIELKTKKEHKILHCLFSERIIFIENKITNEITKVYPENNPKMGKLIIIEEFHDNMRDFSKIIIPKEATPCNHDFAFADLKKFIFTFFENDVCRKFLLKYHDYSFVENVDGYLIEDFNVKNEIFYYFLEQSKLKNKKYNKEFLHIILSLSMLNNNKLNDNDFKRLIDLSLDHFDYGDVLRTSIYDIDYCLNKMLLEINKNNFTIEWDDIINYIFNDLLKQSYNPNSYHIVYYYFEYLYKQILYYREIKSMKTDFLYSDIVKLNKSLCDLKIQNVKGE